jgi:hypothetical protein
VSGEGTAALSHVSGRTAFGETAVTFFGRVVRTVIEGSAPGLGMEPKPRLGVSDSFMYEHVASRFPTAICRDRTPHPETGFPLRVGHLAAVRRFGHDVAERPATTLDACEARIARRVARFEGR